MKEKSLGQRKESETNSNAEDLNVKNVPIIYSANYDSFLIYHPRTKENSLKELKSPMWPVKEFYWNQTFFLFKIFFIFPRPKFMKENPIFFFSCKTIFINFYDN